MKVSTITKVSEIPAVGEEPIISKGKVEKRGGNRFGYNYIFIKSYKESQKNDVVKCLYIKSLTNFGFCVIKEGCYGDTKDKWGRDIIDRLKWQRELHEKLQDEVRMPRLLGHFEENGNYYLVIEHIKGKPFYKACADKSKELREAVITGSKLGIKFLDYLLEITAILRKLHAKGIVHRDATANNFMIMPNGKVAVIDMEMCYSIPLRLPLPAFQLGTYGYMSPQQLATEIPTTAEDIFALGAIILQVWSNVSASKLTDEVLEQLAPKICFFIPDQQLSLLILQCFNPEPKKRPTAEHIWSVLHQYKVDLKYKVQRPQNNPIIFFRENILDVVQQAIGTLATPLFTDELKGWFADKMNKSPNVDKHKIEKIWYASYSRGVTGIIYMLAQAKNVGFTIDVTLPFIQKGIELIKIKYVDRTEKDHPGFHFGADGIAAVLAIGIQNGLISPKQEYLEWLDLLLEKSSHTVNFINGVAGQGLANLICRPFISSIALQQRLERYTQLLADKQEADGSWTHNYEKQKITKRKIKKVTRGFGEGIAGTIYFLLELAKEYDNKDAKEMATHGLQWLMKKATWKKGAITWHSHSRKELYYRWEQGAAGIALVFIKAYEVTGQEMYKKYATATLVDIPFFITDTNISQQGLSGLGEVYLEAYKILHDKQWLSRANWIVQVIMQLKKQEPQYGPYWLVEHERQPVAGFMVGNSGVIHFLLRYCYPDKIRLPLLG